MQIYITDKTGKKFWNTNVSAGFASGERANLQRHLGLILAGASGYNFIDRATAKIIEEPSGDEAIESMTDDELLAELTAPVSSIGDARDIHVNIIAKAQYAATADNGHTYDLLDVSADLSWKDVLCVESHRNERGQLLGVVNHRERTFEQRRAELDSGKF